MFHHDFCFLTTPIALPGAEGWTHGFLGWPSGLASSCGIAALLCVIREVIVCLELLLDFLQVPFSVFWAEHSEYSEIGWPNFRSKFLSSLTSPFCPSWNRIGAPTCSPWDLILEEKGGEQAICPPLAKTEKMDGCRAVRIRRTCRREKRSEGRGSASPALRPAGPLLCLRCVLYLPSLSTLLWSTASSGQTWLF